MERSFRRLNEPNEIRLWQHIAVFVIAGALIISRRPDAIFHPQFWAEDGRVWFAEAYNLGWFSALFRTWTGYFLTLPRLAAAFALLVPFSRAPLLLNLVAIAIQALPVNILISSRSSAWGTLGVRAMLAAAFIGLPSSPEIHANITNAQWLLSFSAFLLIVASPPKSLSGKLFDLAVILLSGLTGPFCIFLVPIAAYVAYRDREPWRRIPVYVLAVSSLLQASALLFVSPAARAQFGVLGPTPAVFVRIISGNVFLGSLIGANHLAIQWGKGFFLFLLLVALGGIAFLALAFIRSPINMRLFVILAFMIFAASLISPSGYAPPGTTRWELVAGASAVRYWFLPTLAFVWLMITARQKGDAALKVISTTLLCLLCFGVAARWRRAPLQDFHFSEAVARFESAPAGTPVVIQLNPEGWSMRLVKKASR